MCRQAVLELAAEPESAAVARRYVGDRCAEWGLEAICDDLVLPVSELITNAVLHARTPVGVTVSLTGSFIEVAVRDGNPRPPVLRPVRLDLDAAVDEADVRDPRLHVGDAGSIAAGRGLRIVDAVADEWGVSELSAGKDVWFRLRCPRGWAPPDECPCAQSTQRSPGGLPIAAGAL